MAALAAEAATGSEADAAWLAACEAGAEAGSLAGAGAALGLSDEAGLLAMLPPNVVLNHKTMLSHVRLNQLPSATLLSATTSFSATTSLSFISLSLPKIWPFSIGANTGCTVSKIGFRLLPVSCGMVM